MQGGCLPPSPHFLPLITAWFLLASLMAYFINSSLWQKCSTTLSCLIMNGRIWSCKYLHLWAYPGKRYKKHDLSKWQPGDQVNHTHPFAVPLPCLQDTVPKRKKVTKSFIRFFFFFAIFSQSPKSCRKSLSQVTSGVPIWSGCIWACHLSQPVENNRHFEDAIYLIIRQAPKAGHLNLFP